MKNLKKLFPYNPRKGQVSLVKNIIHAIENNDILFTHAPTGIGKTVCALSAVRYLDKPCIFVTPRQSQHKIVIDTIRDIGDDSLVVSIIGKKDMCINKEVKKSNNFYESCLNSNCPYRQFGISTVFDKTYHTHEFIQHCFNIDLCPYYTAIDCAQDANIIIANYRHIFDPFISKLFFDRLNKDPEEFVLIIDEAHNLPNTLRSIASMYITDNTIDHALNELKRIKDIELVEKSSKLLGTTILYRLIDIIDTPPQLLNKNEFAVTREDVTFLHKVGDIVKELKHNEGIKSPISYNSRIGDFFSLWLDTDELSYVRILEDKNNRWRLNIECLEPQNLSEVIYDYDSTILMSGTLEPIGYFKEILGFKNASMKKYPSIFPPENKQVIIQDDLTTEYKKRTDDIYREYAHRIDLIAQRTDGNIIVFFPSYNMMHNVRKCSEIKQNHSKVIHWENRDLVKDIHSILETNNNIILAVNRGSLSEGIDYRNNSLQCIIMVGFPYPVMDVRQKALTNYYQVKTGQGFVNAVLFPTINVILQAIGRGIRSETDKCNIYLIDKRFQQYERYFI